MYVKLQDESWRMRGLELLKLDYQISFQSAEYWFQNVQRHKLTREKTRNNSELNLNKNLKWNFVQKSHFS